MTESLPGAFAEVARHTPDRTALVDGGTALTYAEVDDAATGLAAALRDEGVGHGTMVGLVLERTARVPIAVLAVLKLGAVYVPLDPGYPAARLRHMVDDASIGLVVGDLAALPPEVSAGLRGVDLSRRSTTDPGGAPAREDVAYVIYTSGSTGLPKGCQVTHGNVLALVAATTPLLGAGPDDRWSLFHSAGFDVSVFELWAAWSTGATAVVVGSGAARSPHELLALLRTAGVTVLSMVPSVFTQLAHVHAEQGAPELGLRHVLFAGESVQLDVVAAFLERCPVPPVVVNLYGITETTVHATFKVLGPADLHGTVVSPIGRELPHLRIVLRDEDGRPVPPGEPGEIWVHGAGVARGYLNRPELTAERFRATEDGVGYRSGDLARRLPDGELEFLGRGDQQVKLRGFRIELGEVESVLRQHPGVREVAVLVDGATADSRVLLAFFVPVDTAAIPAADELRAAAAAMLPEHMLPHRFEAVAALPFTPSGKLDRQALAEAVRRRRLSATGR
ncbi:amino acid adenylation domain-containing protein [Lentzea sp. NPDC060358]|uniref:amino acid adenylation domain-containing protein n=1 Tax=Lentzea sp. NPDC060358 TaxID=3347103 RepID=UPI00364B7A9C